MNDATYDAEGVTREALAEAGLEGYYNPRKLYANPAKNAKFGQPFNWHNNIVPANVINKIANERDVAKGIAKTAQTTLDNTLNHRYFNTVDYNEADEADWFIGLVQEMTRRDGFGAFGEIWASENAVDGDVQEPQDGDEEKGIDVRTDESTYQIKVGENEKDWDAKEAEHLIWVKTNGDGKIVGYEVDP